MRTDGLWANKQHYNLTLPLPLGATKLYAKAAGGRGSLPLLKNFERQARRGGYVE